MADMTDMLKDFAQFFSASNNAEQHKQQNNINKNNSNIEMPNIDIDSMMKLGKIISAMNSPQNNNGANLLRSLKPYLNQSRQQKVDEYIQLFNIEKVINAMNNLGGDKNNDS